MIDLSIYNFNPRRIKGTFVSWKWNLIVNSNLTRNDAISFELLFSFLFYPEIRNFSDCFEEIITIPVLKARDKFARENSSYIYIFLRNKKKRKGIIKMQNTRKPCDKQFWKSVANERARKMENIKTYKGRGISWRAKTAIKRIMHYTMLALLGLILFRIARRKRRKEAV